MVQTVNLLKNATPTRPWWRHAYVWLVLAGPAVVVFASLFTAYLAYHGSDPVLDEDYYRKGLEINRTLIEQSPNLVPAVQARNHAATGAVPLPQSARQNK